MTQSVCVVVGVGPGNGAALARRFAKEGHVVALLARSTKFSAELAKELGHARAYACDASDPEAVQNTFAQVASDLGAPDVLVWNAGSGTWGSVDEVSVADMENAWRLNVLGAFAAVRALEPSMKERGKGSVVFIGATASRRGGAKAAAFAQAKAAQRSLAQSMARHLWPQGIHVSLIVIDGVVDLPRTRKSMPDKPVSFFVQPDGVAETAWWLTQQPRSAWSFEVEARPFAEKW